MTFEEIVVQGLARVQEYARSYPPVRSVLWRRVGIRQVQLAAMAAKVNRDYFGVAANAVVTAGASDINDIITPVPLPETIHKIEVGAVGAGSPYAVGDEVSIVRLGDEVAEEAPRATIRSGVIRQYKAELATVTSLKVYYSRLPDVPAAGADGAALNAVVPEPHTELLVIDIAKVVIERANLAEFGKMPVYTALVDEEKIGVEAWLAHVAARAGTRSRFTR